jgi:peptidoglycan hydrolase-like protein with peptidoglycan-binding domain
MTDVFVSYASEDAGRVQSLIEALASEGWQVEYDPAAASDTELYAPDDRAGSAGAVLVVWSGDARNSDKIRSEAATALYKNKLVQVRIDTAAPPRPFDQVESSDLSAWSGARDNDAWRAIVARVRTYAGTAGQDRPMVLRAIQTAAGVVRTAPPPPPPSREPEITPEWTDPPPRAAVALPARPVAAGRSVAGGRVGVNRPPQPKKGFPVAPAAALAIAGAVGATVWFFDPLGWFGGSRIASTQVAQGLPGATELTASPVFSGAAAPVSWEVVDRENPTQVRAFLTANPNDDAAETARSTLRVLDAQLWMSAVTLDTEAAYTDYLASFPLGGGEGAMTEAALERLGEIGDERAFAIRAIQQGLESLNLYSGPVDGLPSPETKAAIAAFTKRENVETLDLDKAAPRDLRDFSDRLQTERIAPGSAAVTPAAGSAADAADRARLDAAQRAAAAAVEVAASNADDLALRQLRASDEAAWQRALTSGTNSAYEGYVRQYPNGVHVAEARAELARPAPFSLDALSPELAAAAGAARRAQGTARERAAAARDESAKALAVAASARNGVDGMAVVRSAQGDEYVAQAQDGIMNGLGVRTDGGGASAGDRYSGQLRQGRGDGLGVYEYADNANNAGAGAARYEGEHAGDRASGFGVMVWKNGNYLAGQADGSGAGRGVITFANGDRYEGQLQNGLRDGLGVMWSSSGQVVMSGRWRAGQLIEPAGGSGER